MSIAESIECWIEQAESDQHAAEASLNCHGIGDEHTRYLFQQSYEKAIKAHAIGLYRLDENTQDYTHRLKDFRNNFLHKHSPLTELGDPKKPLSRHMHALKRQLLTFIRNQSFGPIIIQIDKTTPSTNPEKVSYRYPFLVSDKYMSPCSYPPSKWRQYQGDINEVREAVRKLLKKVKSEKVIMKMNR